MDDATTRTVYAFDPAAPPDGDFEPGQLSHLVEGNHARLLDARRTPLVVRAIDRATGTFAVEVSAFEDAGARWIIPLEEVSRLQFARSSPRARASAVEGFRSVVKRLNRPLEVLCDPAALRRTRARIAQARARVRDGLDALGVAPGLDASRAVGRREGDPALAVAARALLAERRLDGIDASFAERYVSNPWSGDLLRGHAIVAAELGLFPYKGKAPRDPGVFEGRWSKARRAEHVVFRLALTPELWSRTGRTEATLYRAAATDGPLGPRASGSFVAATFSREVADAHFAGGPTTRSAVIYRQAVPLDRLFMTFWETPAMNHRYQEAEALLLGADDATF